MAEQFTFFYGHHDGRSPHAECSQWYIRQFIVDGQRFNCCERWMMWRKAMLFGDAETADKIMQTPDPAEQKQLGRRVRNFDEKIWIEHRYPIVREGNLAKFSQNPDLLERLRPTMGTTLVEASRHDRIWGIGLGLDDPLRLHRRNWRGLNLLGQAVTQVRIELCGA